MTLRVYLYLRRNKIGIMIKSKGKNRKIVVSICKRPYNQYNVDDIYRSELTPDSLV